MADPAFLSVMTRRVEVYAKSDDLESFSAWQNTYARLYIRIRPASSSTMGDGWTQQVTHLARTPYVDPDLQLNPRYVEAHIEAGVLLKEVERRDPETGAWEPIQDGSEYLLQAAPENASGADHHLNLLLLRLANNEANVAREIDP